MWIRFNSSKLFAIKIFLGGVNAVSGEPMIEKSATKLRRLNLLAKEKSIQDYVVTPHQLWLDGIASNDGCVRQFVAMPLGSGYSVEAQVTGEDVVGGLQFEITHASTLPPPLPEAYKNRRIDDSVKYPVEILFVKTLTDTVLVLSNVSPSTTILDAQGMIFNESGVPPGEQRLIYGGKQLEDSKFLLA